MASDSHNNRGFGPFLLGCKMHVNDMLFSHTAIVLYSQTVESFLCIITRDWQHRQASLHSHEITVNESSQCQCHVWSRAGFGHDENSETLADARP